MANEAERQRCTTCSIPSVNGGWNITVLAGDGNCPACKRASEANIPAAPESRDNVLPFPTGGDHDDQSYRFGRVQRVSMTGIFSAREMLRLLLLRGQIQDRKIDRLMPDKDGL